MLDLSAAAKLEKNKLEQDGCWIVLLEIVISTDLSIYLCRNTEDITWNGQKWLAFPFDLGEVNEDSKGEIPTTTLKVSNITRSIQRKLEEYNGGVGMTCIIRVVNSEHLELTEPEVEIDMIVKSTDCDNEWVTFNLGTDALLNYRYPQRKVLKDFCPFKFKGVECGYTGALSSCDHTLFQCRLHNNSARFGGEPGITQGGMYINAT